MRVSIGDIIRLDSSVEYLAPVVMGKLAVITSTYIDDDNIVADVQVIGSDVFQTIKVEDIKEIIV